ncbi:MAG: type II toxin-antitoxin system prevent-host-death family antitoxin [Rhodocyclaceae bacterium]
MERLLGQKWRSHARASAECWASEWAAGERLDRLVRRDYHHVQLPVHIEAASMDAMTYTKARASLAQTIDAVCDNHAPVIITKKNDRSVVMLSLEDYQALEETSYLLRNPKNARRLLDSVNELDAGGGTERALTE